VRRLPGPHCAILRQPTAIKQTLDVCIEATQPQRVSEQMAALAAGSATAVGPAPAVMVVWMTAPVQVLPSPYHRAKVISSCRGMLSRFSRVGRLNVNLKRRTLTVEPRTTKPVAATPKPPSSHLVANR
jgi:hypothetical protein